MLMRQHGPLSVGQAVRVCHEKKKMHYRDNAVLYLFLPLCNSVLEDQKRVTCQIGFSLLWYIMVAKSASMTLLRLQCSVAVKNHHMLAVIYKTNLLHLIK